MVPSICPVVWPAATAASRGRRCARSRETPPCPTNRRDCHQRLTGPRYLSEPSQRLADEFLSRRAVARLEDQVPLVCQRRPEEPEELVLRLLDREGGVVGAVQHQDRHRHTRGEVELVRLGKGPGPPPQATGREDRRPEAILERQHHRRDLTAPTVAPVRELAQVNVASRLQVVDGSGEVLRPRIMWSR